MSDDAGMSFGFNFDTSDGPKEGQPARPAGEVKMGGVGATAFEPLPFRVVALANFCGCPAERKPRRVLVDRDDFDGTFAKLDVSLFLTVEDVLGGDSKGLEVRLEPKSLRDLEPARLIEALPAFDLPGKLLEELEAVRDGAMSASQFRGGLDVYKSVPALAETLRLAEQSLKSAGTPASSGEAPKKVSKPLAPSGGDATVDSILSMVDTGEPEAPPPSAAKGKGSTGIGAVISAIGGGGSKKRAANVGAALDALSAVLSKQVNAILHHEQFRQVEAAWRGLKLLVDRSERKSPVKLEALDCDRDSVQEVFHDHVWKIEYEGKGESALSLAVVDFAFDNTSADLAVLEALATDAEQIQAPVVASLASGFTGVTPEKLSGMGNARALFEQGFAEWRGKRKLDSTRWLCAAFNRVLMRMPHKPGRRAGPVTESPELLWGNPGWLPVATAVRSMAQGWPTGVTGARDGSLADMPVWAGDGDAVGPLEVCLSDNCVADLASEGITGITQRKNSDVGLVLRAPVVHRVGTESKVRHTLAYQLLAARLGETVLTYKQKVAGGSHDEVVGRFKAFVEALLGNTGPGARVDVQAMPDPEDASRLLIGMTAYTGRAVLGGVQVDLGIRV